MEYTNPKTGRRAIPIQLRARPNTPTEQPNETAPAQARETSEQIPAKPTSEAPSSTERTPSAADPDAPMTNSDGREL